MDLELHQGVIKCKIDSKQHLSLYEYSHGSGIFYAAY